MFKKSILTICIICLAQTSPAEVLFADLFTTSGDETVEDINAAIEGRQSGSVIKDPAAIEWQQAQAGNLHTATFQLKNNRLESSLIAQSGQAGRASAFLLEDFGKAVDGKKWRIQLQLRAEIPSFQGEPTTDISLHDTDLRFQVDSSEDDLVSGDSSRWDFSIRFTPFARSSGHWLLRPVVAVNGTYLSKLPDIPVLVSQDESMPNQDGELGTFTDFEPLVIEFDESAQTVSVSLGSVNILRNQNISGAFLNQSRYFGLGATRSNNISSDITLRHAIRELEIATAE